MLVSEPFNTDPYTRAGVIALIDSSEENGATGVVLNRPTEYTLADLVDDVAPENDLPVYCGGPTGLDRVYFIHTLGNSFIPGARPFGNGLWIGGDFDAMLQYLNSGTLPYGAVRFFMGYKMWAPLELEYEISHGRWAIDHRTLLPASILTGDGFNYWHRAVRHMGTPYRPWQLLPENPVLN